MTIFIYSPFRNRTDAKEITRDFGCGKIKKELGAIKIIFDF